MTRVRLDQIAFDAGTQIRAAINEQVVAEYAERMTEGVVFPPIVLFHDGNQHYLADGFHRALAAQRNQFRDISADVRPGTKTDALWFALGANKANGQRMTEADKKHAIVLAVQAWPTKSAGVISEQLGVNHVYVTRIRAQVLPSKDLEEKVIGRDGKSYPAKREASTVIEAQRNERRGAVGVLVKEGRSSKEIVQALKIRPEEVAAVRRELGSGRDTSREAVAQKRKDVRDMASRGFTTRQIASAIGVREPRVAEIAKAESIVIHADRVVGKSKRHDANRIVARMVQDAENLCADVALIDFDCLDAAQLPEWLKSLQQSREQLGGFIRRLMKEQQKHGQEGVASVAS